VLGLIGERPPDFPPGTSWRYNNSGYYLAGMVIEAVTRMPLAEYLRRSVFQPLGMKSASLCTARDHVPSLATGYATKETLVPAPAMAWSLPFAGGGICATAGDLLKWQEGLERGRFLPAASLTAMREPTRLDDGTAIDYGLGTRIGTLGRLRIYGHTGTGGGFNNTLVSVPDARLSIAVLANTDPAPTSAIADAIASSVLGVEPISEADLDVPAAELGMLTGTYESDEGEVTLDACGSKLCFRTPEGASGRARRQGAYRYLVGPGLEVRFDAARGASWAFVYAGGLMMDAKRRVDR
jgi:CubicO group peptidase (beta-lactamase class C family)